MNNDNLLLGINQSDSNLPINEVSVLDNPQRLLEEMDRLPSAEKQRNVKRLGKLRLQVETENRQLEKRVKLIKKEEQIVLDKILAGMLHEEKLRIAKLEDEKFRTTFNNLKQREMQQTMAKREKIVALRQQSEQIKKEKSTRILSIKKENYLYATEVKNEAQSLKRSIQIKNLNCQFMQAQPKLKFKKNLAESLKRMQEVKASQHLDQLAREEAERLRLAKRLNKSLHREQFKAYDALLKERSFHKQFFSSLFLAKKL